MLKRYLLAACGLALAGCAATPSPVRDAPTTNVSVNSLALQVMRADGRSDGLKDVQVDLPNEVSSEAFVDTLDALLLREHVLGRATPMPGVSNAAMSAFFALELLNDRTYLPRRGMWMPVWMPYNLARNPLEAQLKMTEIIERAIVEALPEGYRVEPYEWTDKAVFGAESSYRILRLEGPLCEQWSCLIQGNFSSVERPERSSQARMVKAPTPSFIQSDEEWSYRFRGLGGVAVRKVLKEYDEQGKISGHWHRIETESLSGFDHSAFYRRLSAALPDWAFIYFGPQEVHNQAGIPYVLNRGKELLFVKPANSSNAKHGGCRN